MTKTATHTEIADDAQAVISGVDDLAARPWFHRMIVCPEASLRFIMWRDEPQAEGWQEIDKDDPSEEERFAAIQAAIIARNPKDGKLDHEQFHAVLEEMRGAFPQVKVTELASRIGQVSMTFTNVSRQGHPLTADGETLRFHRAVTTSTVRVAPVRRYGATRASSHRGSSSTRRTTTRNKSPSGDDPAPARGRPHRDIARGAA